MEQEQAAEALTQAQTPCVSAERNPPACAVEDSNGGWINPRTGEAACGAKCRDGRRCPARPVVGAKRCRMHGGRTPSGIASPNWQGKGYSKDLPAHLAEWFQEAINDPDLISSRQEIALLYARTKELISRLNTGESGAWLADLREAAADYRSALESEDGETASSALNSLLSLVEQGGKYETAWKELIETADKKTKVAEREVKRLVAQEQVMTADRAGVLIGALISAVRAEVKDQDTLTRLGRRFSVILAGGPNGTPINVESRPAISQEPPL